MNEGATQVKGKRHQEAPKSKCVETGVGVPGMVVADRTVVEHMKQKERAEPLVMEGGHEKSLDFNF